MIGYVFFVCLSVIVKLVASNPVPQLTPGQNSPNYQQNPYSNSVAASYQQPASQTLPYTQPSGVQYQKPNRPGFDGNVNQLLINKILENPCLQKILDPNTKLYNQNGQEIQRHQNSGTVPNVINNYFIVPPEFFNINNTQYTQDAVQSTTKRKKNSTGRNGTRNKNKTNLNIAEDNDSHITFMEKRPNLETNDQPVPKSNKNTKKGKRNRKNDQSSAKIIENNEQIDVKDKIIPYTDVNQVKRKRKLGSSNCATKSVDSTSLPIETESALYVTENMTTLSEKQLKLKTKSNPAREKLSPINFEDDTIYTLKTDSVKNEIIENISAVEEPSSFRVEKENLNGDKKSTNMTNNKSQLKNIESPVENRDITRELTENRKTRNSKNNNIRKHENPSPNFTPFPNDMYRNFYPYMYMGNYFYPHDNLPFNFESIYQPAVKNNRKNKKRKNRKKEKEQKNRKSSPNVVEVPIKIKIKKKEGPKEGSTTANPVIIESTEETQVPLDISSVEVITQPAESISDIPVEIIYEDISQSSEKEFEPVIPKKDSTVTKANLEMPPTMIEDLSDYVIPNFGREDIIPTVHTNGIINDYYPIFNDDSYYNDDGSYFLRDLEDDRHFYTTDQVNEGLLNRDRRKYDRNDDYRTPNLDIKDRVHFIRGYKHKDSETIKNGNDATHNSIPYTHAKLIEQEIVPPKIKNDGVHFHTPPKLENPDFITKKIEVVSPKTSVNTIAEYDPVYTGDLTENVSENTVNHLKTSETELNRMVNADLSIRKERIPPKNVRPKNDHIETVYAKTRVVKYGITKDESEENISASMPAYDDGNESKFFSNGHTTFVVAKSLGHVDDYYW